MVNLSPGSASSDRPSHTRSAERLSAERSGKIAGIIGERVSQARSGESGAADCVDLPGGEICIYSGERIPAGEFESHIEDCNVCANRVELQLDFMETLELAVYQRKSEPWASRVHGAMLVSAPELNFAVCGEIETT